MPQIEGLVTYHGEKVDVDVGLATRVKVSILVTIDYAPEAMVHAYRNLIKEKMILPFEQ